MKRTAQALLIGFVVLAFMTRARETMGAYTCGCDDDCWCKQPGLSLFRWVVPRGHRSRGIEAWKRAHENG